MCDAGVTCAKKKKKDPFGKRLLKELPVNVQTPQCVRNVWEDRPLSVRLLWSFMGFT